MCFEWIEKRIKKMKWYDISLIKLSTALAILIVAKLWSPILSLGLHVYVVLFAVVTLLVVKRMFFDT